MGVTSRAPKSQAQRKLEESLHHQCTLSCHATHHCASKPSARVQKYQTKWPKYQPMALEVLQRTTVSSRARTRWYTGRTNAMEHCVTFQFLEERKKLHTYKRAHTCKYTHTHNARSHKSAGMHCKKGLTKFLMEGGH